MLRFSDTEVNATLIAGDGEIIEAPWSFAAVSGAVGANPHADRNSRHLSVETSHEQFDPPEEE